MLLATIICIGYWKAPEEISLEYSVEEPEQPASKHTQVTCNADCQVSFGLSGDENLANESQGNPANTPYSASSISIMDLNAQRSMAHWAKVLAWLTFVGAIILVATLLETANATDAAHKSADETKRIGEAQTRAYLSITGGEAELDRTLPMVLTIRMNVHNTGNSPAAAVTIFAEACFEDRQEPGGIYRFDAGELEVDEVGGNISYPRELIVAEFDLGKLDPLLDNQGNIGIHGRIEYRHVFMSNEEEPIVASFALSGLIDDKRSNWGKETVITHLNTCRHSRWEKTQRQI